MLVNFDTRHARRMIAGALAALLGVLSLVLVPWPAAAATFPAATTTVTVTPTQAAIGQTVQYVLRVTLPAGQAYPQATITNLLSLGMTQVGGSSVSCVAGGVDCSTDLPGRSSGYALAPSGQRLGWYLGNVAARATVRVVTVTFSARIDDVARNFITVPLADSAVVSWDTASGAPPSNAGYAFAHSGATSAPVILRVMEPLLSVSASVSTVTPEPGEVFRFTTRATNANAVYTSTAFAAVITQSVPVGVVVDVGSISGGGTLSAGLITWLPGTIAKNATVTLTWEGRLAATEMLTLEPLVSSARVAGYRSLTDGGRVYPSTPVSAAVTVTPDLPVLSLAKDNANAPLAYLGESHAWRVTVTNTGRSTATDIVVGDVLPANWRYDVGSASVAGDGDVPVAIAPAVTGDPSSGTRLTWRDLGSLTPGSSFVVTYTATPLPAALVDAGAGSTIAHTNSASASASDLTGAPGTSLATFTATDTASAYLGSADLALTMSATRLVAGTAVPDAWTITVRNDGADEAAGPFQVTDTPRIASGLTITNAGGTGWSCDIPDPGTGQFVCRRADANETLAPGSAFPAILVAASLSADLPAGAEFENSAAVRAATWDADLSDNADTATSAVDLSADLAIDIATSGSYSAGQPATGTIDVSNGGPSISRGPIVVTFAMPPGTYPFTVVGLDWDCVIQDRDVICTYADDLAIGSAPRITLSSVIPSNAMGSPTISATVTGSTPDPDSSDNTESHTIDVATATALALDKAMVGTHAPGATVDYTLEVRNIGSADARGVVVTDGLPEGLEFAGMTAAAGWACDATPAPTTVTCVLTSDLTSGSTATVAFAVRIPEPQVENLVNVAAADAENAEAITATHDTALVGQSDLGIDSALSGSAHAGSPLTYVVTVHNYGPTDAPAGLQVIDHVDDRLTPISATGVGWDCDAPSGQQLSCVSLVGVPSGATASPLQVTVATSPDDGPASFDNIAIVQGGYEEPTPDPHANMTTESTMLTDLAAVTILRSISPGGLTVTAGETIDYVITVRNAGPSTADSVDLTGIFPAGFIISAYSGPGWTCDLETLSCARPDFGVGSATVTVTVATSPDIADGTVVANSAEVAWTDSRPDRNVDIASVQVTVRAVADLVMTKTALDSTPAAGDDLTYELLLYNAGPSTAVAPVTIIDTLPVGIRFASAGDGWTCVASPVAPDVEQPVTCDLADGAEPLVAGGTAPTLRIDTSTSADLDRAVVENAARATSPTTEGSMGDNSAAATVVFGAEADLALIAADVGDAIIGGTIPLTGIIRNVGPSDAEAVTVSLALPAGLGYLDSAGSATAWTCSATAAISGVTAVECSLEGGIAATSDAPDLVVRVTVLAAAYPAVDIDARVSSTTPDSDSANNRVVATLRVAPLVELTVQKSHTGVAQVGGMIDYLITVVNTGPTEDPGDVVIVDTLPPGLALVAWSGSGVTCTEGGATVTCVFEGIVPSGGSRSVVVTALVLPGAEPTIVNSVVASSGSEQLPTSSLTASDSAILVPGLAITGWSAGMLVLLLAGGVLAVGLGLRTVAARTRSASPIARVGH